MLTMMMMGSLPLQVALDRAAYLMDAAMLQSNVSRPHPLGLHMLWCMRTSQDSAALLARHMIWCGIQQSASLTDDIRDCDAGDRGVGGREGQDRRCKSSHMLRFRGWNVL
jgi:hypothetical protein